MESIFSSIICALPVVIKLLGGITEKIIVPLAGAAAFKQLFLPSTNHQIGMFTVSFLNMIAKMKKNPTKLAFLITRCVLTNSGALKGCQETTE